MEESLDKAAQTDYVDEQSRRMGAMYRLSVIKEVTSEEVRHLSAMEPQKKVTSKIHPHNKNKKQCSSCAASSIEEEKSNKARPNEARSRYGYLISATEVQSSPSKDSRKQSTSLKRILTRQKLRYKQKQEQPPQSTKIALETAIMEEKRVFIFFRCNVCKSMSSSTV